MRPSCSSCNRPLRVCLCEHLPAEPIHTATRLLILQHPHETRHRLATVPIILRCLSNCHVIVGRRLQLGTSQLLDAFLASSSPSPSYPEEEDAPAKAPDASGWQCCSCGRKKWVLLLFPTPSAVELTTWIRSQVENSEDLCCESLVERDLRRDCDHEGEAEEKLVERFDKSAGGGGASGQLGRPEGAGLGFSPVCGDGEAGHVILLVVDGTWQHAREMVKASMPFLGDFVEQVCLPHDMAREGWGMGDSNSIIRKEPFAGCVSTMEAVARTLRMLEPNGVHIEQTLLSVLRQMVSLQATHFTPLKPRPRLSKKHPVNYGNQSP